METTQRLKMKKKACLFFMILSSVLIFAFGNEAAETKKDYPLCDMYLGSKIPYPGPGKPELTPIPEGYEANFIYWVNRHGSRNLSGFKYDKAWLELLVFAESEGQLTKKGKVLLKEIQKIVEHEKGRYGLLTGLGKNELYKIGKRTGDLYKNLFGSNKPLLAEATYKERTWESRDNFLKGLKESGYKGEITFTRSEKNTDPYLRPFDIAAKYKKYKKAGKWYQKIDAFAKINNAEVAARRIVSPFFKPEFSDKLNKGGLEFKSEKNEVVINNLVSAAYSLWEIYTILPALKEDGLSGIDMKK